MLRSGKLAEMVGFTRQHVHRLASENRIPGAKRTKGGQLYFVDCQRLGDWIADNRYRNQEKKKRKQWSNRPKDARLSDGPVIKTIWNKLDALEAFLFTKPDSWWDQERKEVWAVRLEPLANLYAELTKASRGRRR